MTSMEHIYSISYATSDFKKHQKIHAFTAKWIGGADTVRRYTPEDLDSDFKERNAAILSQPRGAGYWIWKPYICLKTLKAMPEGDYLFYCDAGAYFVNRIRHLLNFMRQEKLTILPFSQEHREQSYTKRDTLIALNCDTEEKRLSWQILSGYFLAKNCAPMREFFAEFLHWAEQHHLIDDSPSLLGEEYPEFIDHRHDQSIFSLLCKLHGFSSFRDPSEWGDRMVASMSSVLNDPFNTETAANMMRSPYPRIVESCRRKSPLEYRAKLLYNKYVKGIT